MSNGSVDHGSAWRKTRTVPVLLAMVGMLFALLAIGANTAKAEPVGYQFDRGIINLGGEEGTWAKLIDPDLDPPDPPATLAADVAGDGALTAAAEDFNFPVKRIENLDVTEAGQGVLFFVDATVKITAEGPITGNFDTATGASNVTIPADVLITVYNHGSPSSIARCRIDGFDLELNTTAPTMSDPGAPADPPTPERPAADYAASAFDPADEGKGAMIASWAGLPASENEGGALGGAICTENGLDSLLGGPGGAWLDGAASGTIKPVDPPPPVVAPKITGTPSASTDSTTASFTYAEGEGETSVVAGFQCKLDAGAFEACDSGTKDYSDLAVGGHTFEVKALNAQGLAGPVASYSWEVTGVTDPGVAKLGKLTVKPASKSVKPGKKATFTAKVNNTGDAVATGVKICVTAPKKLVSVKKCVTVGKLAAGASKSVKFKVTVSKKAKKGKKAVLKFKATSKNAGTKSGKATVKVK
jgi:uncharacterized repeat protein (TIGR01451 family)